MSTMFWMPTEIRFGWGTLAALGELSARRAFIVADQAVVESGFAEQITNRLRAAGAATALFTDVVGEPTRAVCVAGAERLADFQPECVVAVGGGSVMDAAKAMWTLYESPGVSLAELIALRAVHPQRQPRARFVAVPSTSGTGSEVGGGAIITDGAATPRVKHGLRTGFPHLAIVDPALPSTMPPRVTAATGYDALVHALESYVSRSATDVTRALAVGTIRTVLRWLPRAVADGRDREARERLHNAGTTGGICMRGGLGVVHAAAHASGAVFTIPHGVINAVMAAHGVAFNAQDPAAAAGYADLADALGLGGATPTESVQRLITALSDLRRAVDLPDSLRAAGADPAAFDAHLGAIAANALLDGNMASNPRHPTADEMAGFFRAVFAGER